MSPFQKLFQHASALSLHKDTQCGTVRNFQCNSCNKKHYRQDSLTSHIKSCKGNKSKIWICENCSKEFQSSWHLKRNSGYCLNQKQKMPSKGNDQVCDAFLVKLSQKKKVVMKYHPFCGT